MSQSANRQPATARELAKLANELLAAMRPLFPEWEATLAGHQFNAALARVLELYAPSVPATDPDEQVRRWLAVGAAVRAANVADVPAREGRHEVPEGTGSDSGFDLDQFLAGSLVWTLIGEAANGDIAALSRVLREELPPLLAAGHADYFREWLSVARERLDAAYHRRKVDEFAGRLDGDFRRLGLTPELVRLVGVLPGTRDEKNAFQSWLRAWAGMQGEAGVPPRTPEPESEQPAESTGPTVPGDTVAEGVAVKKPRGPSADQRMREAIVEDEDRKAWDSIQWGAYLEREPQTVRETTCWGELASFRESVEAVKEVKKAMRATRRKSGGSDATE